MDPNFALAHNQLAQAYLQEHEYYKAVTELKTAVQLSADSPTCIANLARAYVASGKRNEAEKLLGDLKTRSNAAYSNAPEIAMVYVSLGDTEQAMNWLEKGYEERFNPGVLLRPGFDPLRSDSRFQNLLRRIGLSGEAFTVLPAARGFTTLDSHGRFARAVTVAVSRRGEHYWPGWKGLRHRNRIVPRAENRAMREINRKPETKAILGPSDFAPVCSTACPECWNPEMHRMELTTSCVRA
jgi:tetratricopeptide (TPR) repeat protein